MCLPERDTETERGRAEVAEAGVASFAYLRGVGAWCAVANLHLRSTNANDGRGGVGGGRVPVVESSHSFPPSLPPMHARDGVITVTGGGGGRGLTERVTLGGTNAAARAPSTWPAAIGKLKDEDAESRRRMEEEGDEDGEMLPKDDCI